MDKYLLEILKEHNTIIIPGLGALTITNSDTGETMFMPYLQHDDGKLAAFVAENDGLEEADARIMVGRYVREIQATLSKGETYSMFQLGTFSMSEDGDVEYEHWENPATNKQAVETPVTGETNVVADKPVVEPEPKIEVDPEVIPEPVVEVAPVIEPEPEVIPEPVVNDIPEPKFDAEEIEIKNSIEKALENTPEVKPDIVKPIATPEVPKEMAANVTLEPSASVKNVDNRPVEEKIAATAPTMESEEIEEKEKPSVKFWIYLILIAILIIGGGAYIGRNYNELKQHVPFLADEKPKVKEKPVLDEMDELIKSGQNKRTSDRDRTEQDGTDVLNDANSQVDEGKTDEVIEDKTPVKPEPIEKPEPRPVTIAPSSGGHYHVIAGAFSSVDNANNLAKEFKAKGLASSVIMNGELNAVSMQSYATSEEANAALPKLKQMQPGAWILYK